MVYHRSLVITTSVNTDNSVAKTVKKPAIWQPIPTCFEQRDDIYVLKAYTEVQFIFLKLNLD